MTDLVAARSQMALSLGFHIIYACIGMVMPFFMAMSHYQWIKTGDVVYRNVTRAWSKGVAIFFATGAVSGTMLSVELGLLWPGFMLHAGPIIGMPFSLEGTAFFIEAIALGFYLYGWDRFKPWFHWFTGVVVGISGLVSGILVVAANSWMNSPAGFKYLNGQYLDINPWRAMFNKAWFAESLHMTIGAFAATGFAVAGVHALMVVRRQNVIFHRHAFRIAALFAIIAALLQPLAGDVAAKSVAKLQPAKLAAMESYFHTQQPAPFLIGGIPDEAERRVKYGIEIPGLLTFLVHDNLTGEVKGLDQFPADEQPPVAIIHYAFQAMIWMGMFMMLVAILYIIAVWKKRDWLDKKWLLQLFIVCIPIGFLAIEAGWIVTEVGRQPWIIQGIMRTADAVTPMPGIRYTFYLFSLIYGSLSCAVIFLLYRQIKMVPQLYDNGSQPVSFTH